MLLRCAARAGTSILRGSRASLLPRAPLRPLCQAPHLDPVVPSPDRMLPAVVRTKLGGNATALLSTKQPDRVPAMLQGDWLPNVPVTVDRAALMVFLRRVHFQRELLTLDVEGGETVRVLVQQVHGRFLGTCAVQWLAAQSRPARPCSMLTDAGARALRRPPHVARRCSMTTGNTSTSSTSTSGGGRATQRAIP